MSSEFIYLVNIIPREKFILVDVVEICYKHELVLKNQIDELIIDSECFLSTGIVKMSVRFVDYLYGTFFCGCRPFQLDS